MNFSWKKTLSRKWNLKILLFVMPEYFKAVQREPVFPVLNLVSVTLSG